LQLARRRPSPFASMMLTPFFFPEGPRCGLPYGRGRFHVSHVHPLLFFFSAFSCFAVFLVFSPLTECSPERGRSLLEFSFFLSFANLSNLFFPQFFPFFFCSFFFFFRRSVLKKLCWVLSGQTLGHPRFFYAREPVSLWSSYCFFLCSPVFLPGFFPFSSCLSFRSVFADQRVQGF